MEYNETERGQIIVQIKLADIPANNLLAKDIAIALKKHLERRIKITKIEEGKEDIKKV